MPALWTVLTLLTLLGVSGPHRVHHLFEVPAPPDHHTHHDQQPVAPDCPVLFAWQHTPVAAASLVTLPPLLAAPEGLVALPACWASAAPYALSQARAPPLHRF